MNARKPSEEGIKQLILSFGEEIANLDLKVQEQIKKAAQSRGVDERRRHISTADRLNNEMAAKKNVLDTLKRKSKSTENR